MFENSHVSYSYLQSRSVTYALRVHLRVWLNKKKECAGGGCWWGCAHKGFRSQRGHHGRSIQDGISLVHIAASKM